MEVVVSSAGSFHTSSSTETFPAAFTAPPDLIHGLNHIDASKSTNVCVTSSVKDVATRNFKIHVGTWGESKLKSGGASWLGLSRSQLQYELGAFSTSDVYHWSAPREEATRRIEFEHAFDAPPKVLAWFTMLDFEHGQNWRVRMDITHVTEKGFTLRIHTRDGTVLRGATAQWIAYKEEEGRIFGGTACTTEVRSARDPHITTTKKVEFPHVFAKTPNVFMAINELDADCNQDLRIRVAASKVTPKGFFWNIDTWEDSKLYAASVAYLCVV